MIQNIRPTGDSLAEAGQEIVIANDAVKDNAGDQIRKVIDEYIKSGCTFTADDVREAFIGNEVIERAMFMKPNLLPALIAGASRRGLIVAVGYCKPSRASRHANPNRIWQAVKHARAAA